MAHHTRVLFLQRIAYGAVALCAIVVLIAPANLRAQPITATARIFCPANLVAGTGHIDTTFALTPVNVPCAGIRVIVMDADPLADEMCGAAYTDSQGRVTIRGECGDSDGSPPDLYLKVQARSPNGFSVGTVDVNVVEEILEEIAKASAGVPPPATRIVDVFDDLRDHQTFEWISTQVPSGAFGNLMIGAGRPVSLMAARQFWTTQFTMNRLLAGTRFAPMDFNYSLNAPIGFPTTLYDTVIVDARSNTGTEANRALRATAHEIGHVLYNTYHSGVQHWIDDALPGYMINHARCDTDHTQAFAWYEGFADFVRDYVFQRWDWNTWSWALSFRPFAGCAFNVDGRGAFVGPRSMSVEGNVQGFLNDVFFGPVRVALDERIRAPAPTSFSCPPGLVLIDAGAAATGGTPQCESKISVSCTTGGSVHVDSRGVVDECAYIRPDPECVPCPPGAHNCSPECEQVEERISAGCRGDRAVRQPGPDLCLAHSPAQPIPSGPPIVPQFICRVGQTLVPPPRPAPFGAAQQCQLSLPIECERGVLQVDGSGVIDQCSILEESAACKRERERLESSDGSTANFRCENLEETTLPAGCSMGTATRRAGRDSCFARVPAIHDKLPNGNPRERPGGSPDAVLGFDLNGAPAWFGLPSLDDVMGWVNTAGANGHRANEFWSGWIRQWCLQRDGLRDRYCNPNRSPSFRGELNRLDPALQ